MGQAESSAPEPLGEGPSQPPCALVVVGPSGVGKGTLIARLMQENNGYGFSCSHTTRAPRPGEIVRQTWPPWVVAARGWCLGGAPCGHPVPPTALRPGAPKWRHGQGCGPGMRV